MYQYYNTNSSRVVTTQRSNLTSFIVQSLSASRTSGWAQMEAALRDFKAVDSTRIFPRAFLAKRSVLPARVVAKTAARNDTFSSDDDGADETTTNAKKKIVVVGAGWGGWGAAKAVAESETASVVLLDGVPDPTGRTGTRATSGKPFEAGVRGFWKDYPNINHLVVSDGLLSSWRPPTMMRSKTKRLFG